MRRFWATAVLALCIAHSPTFAASGKGEDQTDLRLQWWMTIATVSLVLTGVLQFGAAAFTFSLMRGTARTQLRAFLIIDNVEIRRLEAGHPIEAAIRIENVGQTPAYAVSHQITVMTCPYPIENFVLPQDDQRVASSRYAIPKAAEIHVRSAAQASSQDVTTVQHGGVVRVIVAGTIGYADIFGRRQTTSFSVTIHGNLERQIVEYFGGNNAAS